ncbi:MAG: Lactate utilization protein, partial [Actinomycetota bacterium]
MSATTPREGEEVGGRPLPEGWAAPAHQPGADSLADTTFAERARENLARPFQRTAIANATDYTVAALQGRFAGTAHDDLREQARRIRAHAIANLPAYLEQWVERAEGRGIRVHFAADEAEARRLVAGICSERGVRRVVKSKSMASEEVSLNSALEGAGIDVVETDLGEFVVQAMGDRPSHVIAPILHRTQGEVHELFSAMAGED